MKSPTFLVLITISIISRPFAYANTTLNTPGILLARKGIFYFPFDGIENGDDLNNVIKVEVGNGTTVALDYSYQDKLLFWSDFTEKRFFKYDIEKKSKTAILWYRSINAESVAVDWIYKNIYFINLVFNSIEISNFEGDKHKVLFTIEVGKRRSIIVDPKNGFIFWSDWGDMAKIERAGADGTDRETIINKSIIWPTGITLDIENQILFWADSALGEISSSNYDGNERKIILEENCKLKHPFSIAVYDDKIYWSDWKLKAVYMANKSNGENVQRVPSSRNKKSPMTIQIFHPKKQIEEENKCGNCSFLCVSSPKREPTCICSNGQTLTDDGINCQVENCHKNREKFMCDNKCIDKSSICNRINDCADKTDETNCAVARPICLEDEFRCNNGICIPKKQVCDLVFDCPEKEDETACNISCGPKEFACNNRCIALQRLCDGRPDCFDGSDEMNCPPQITETTLQNCTINEFRCITGRKRDCILKRWVCDEDFDCLDKTDEQNCP